jgi:hypothetical protein
MGPFPRTFEEGMVVPSKRGSRNRTARRASLQTWVDRVRSSKRQARAGASAKPSASGTRRTRIGKRQSSLAPRTVVVGTLCLVAAAALVMSRNSSVVNWVAEVDARGNVQRLERVDDFDPAQIATPAADTPVSPRPSTRTMSLTPTLEPEPKGAAPASAAYEFAPAPAVPAEPAPRIVPASLRTTEAEPAPASAPPSNEQTEAPVPATIVGCLERDADTFMLKNVSGADAPKSRSWKSGFLRKKSSNVALVDRAGLSNRLSTYVGRRIETTGALADREMHVKTLRVLGACE